ncbi:MAG: hypothetical protein K1X29_01620 [Bdellovibrionales bacterium]|nr:hypothetical protein [Bdellovibrionales bacterium]
MKNLSKKYKNFFVLSLVSFNSIAFAEGESMFGGGFFAEPSVTFETSQSSVHYPSPLSGSSGKVEGFGVGARLGLHFKDVFFAGLDGRYGMPQFKDSSTKYNSRATQFNWGPVVGMQMPDLGMRVWGAYVVDGQLNPEKSDNFDVKFSQARGFRVGVGFRVSVVSLNLEYQDLEHRRTKLEQIGPFAAGTNFNDVNLNNKSWIASVSFPMEL